MIQRKIRAKRFRYDEPQLLIGINAAKLLTKADRKGTDTSSEIATDLKSSPPSVVVLPSKFKNGVVLSFKLK